MRGNSFNHGSVRMTFNRIHMPTGPGQFKLYPYLIKTGALNSVIKQTIYEANLFNTDNAELTKLYGDKNIIVVHLLQRITDIKRETKENNNWK